MVSAFENTAQILDYIEPFFLFFIIKYRLVAVIINLEK